MCKLWPWHPDRPFWVFHLRIQRIKFSYCVSNVHLPHQIGSCRLILQSWLFFCLWILGNAWWKLLLAIPDQRRSVLEKTHQMFCRVKIGSSLEIFIAWILRAIYGILWTSKTHHCCCIDYNLCAFNNVLSPLRSFFSVPKPSMFVTKPFLQL